MKITRCPEVRAAPNGIYFKVLYLFVLYNCAVSLHAEDTIQKASLADEPVAQRNFAFLNTSEFAPDCVYPHKSNPKTALKLRLRGFGITSQIFAHLAPGCYTYGHLSGSKTVKTMIELAIGANGTLPVKPRMKELTDADLQMQGMRPSHH